LALCAWCGWASGLHRSTLLAEVSWVLSLAAVLAVDLALWRGRRRMRFGWHLVPVAEPWPRPGRGGSRLALRGVAPWIVLFVVALGWDVLGLDTGPHEYHLTISALSQAYRPLNAALLLVWILVGIGFGAARARSPLDLEGAPSPPARTDPDAPAQGTTLTAGMITLGGHPTVRPTWETRSRSFNRQQPWRRCAESARVSAGGQAPILARSDLAPRIGIHGFGNMG